jgi:hypothetical protein
MPEACTIALGIWVLVLIQSMTSKNPGRVPKQ